MNLDNYIEGIYRDMQSSLKEDYVDLYSFFDDERLQYIFSTIHTDMMAELKSMNTRLPTREYEAHFWADSSRILLSAIELLEDLFRKLKKTKYEFIIDEYYEAVIKKCNTFLSPRYGSTIPAHMDKIELYYTIPIIKQLNVINIENPDIQNTATLKLIGEGSYAHVYTYVDQFYNKQYVVKRAKKNLTEKEIQRFKQEYKELKQLSSPYIVEVYRYNDDKKEYIMEYMDYTLCDFIEKNNSTLDKMKRKSIGFQIIRAFQYIHSKNLLHRDISPNNVLIKKYDDIEVIKVSDFGLVKIPKSDLTSLQTEVKGCFNDPNLHVIGFSNYSMVHETYALTRLLYFVMTGKTNCSKISDSKLQKFVQRGMHSDESKRYQTLSELYDEFKNL